MKRDDNLFDEEIRRKLKEEINFVPNNINKKIDESILKGKKKSYSKKIVSSICAASLSGIFLFGVTMPAYAKNIPIIGSIFEKFQLKTYENYDKYSSDFNIAKESNGVTMTINKVVYDGIDLEVFFALENLPKNKHIDFNYDVEINGKKINLAGSQNGRYLNENKTFVGSLQLSMDVIEKSYYGDYVEMPDEFTLTLDIRSGHKDSKENIIQGNWNFDIPVSNEKVKGQVKEKNINVNLSSICKDTYVNKLITTPINTVIEVTTEDEKFNDISFIVFDDKGRYIESKGGYGLASKDENDKNKYYDVKAFKEIYEDTKALTFIPYEFIELEDEFDNENNSSEASKNKIIETKLNLKGETKVKSNSGGEFATITRIDIKDNKTTLYFKSKYSINAAPFEIIDKNTGEKIKPLNEVYPEEVLENISYSYNTEEYAITFDKALTSDDYLIKFYDISKVIKVFENEKFILNIPK